MTYKDKTVIQIYVPNSMYTVLKNEAEKSTLSLSGYLRLLLRKEVDRIESEGQPQDQVVKKNS